MGFCDSKPIIKYFFLYWDLISLKYEMNAFIKACKKTKWTDGKHKGVNKSGRTCRNEWAELNS